MGMDTLAVENPVKRLPNQYSFTPERARLAALRSAESRAAAREKAERDAQEAAELKARLAAETPQSARLATQLRQIEELMDGEKDADTLQKLSAAHARIFSAWQVLTGTPRPATARGQARRQAPSIAPIGPASTPDPAP